MDMDTPRINWFGGVLITRSLLEWSKSGVENDDDPDSFVSKLNRVNLLQRAMLVAAALNAYGPTLEAARAIQGDGKGFFTGVSTAALTDKPSGKTRRSCHAARIGTGLRTTMTLTPCKLQA
jgi:hypothetical protein